jgi:DNA-binding NarL/FixJ family response regulator
MGPRNVYIPNQAARCHPIANAIGYAAMQALCRAYGGETVWIGTGYATAQRNEEISRMCQAGLDTHTIAERFSITERYVRAIARGYDDSPEDEAPCSV